MSSTLFCVEAIAMTKTSNYTLYLPSSLLEELRKVAEQEGTTINQFINVAVAEKLAVLRTVEYFQERASNADGEWFRQFLETGGGDSSPRKGDELPQELLSLESLSPTT
jgi:hypothetical protein